MNSDTTQPMPEVVDRSAFQAELDALRVREKAHTRAGDAIAAARRRLMACYQMWLTGRLATDF